MDSVDLENNTQKKNDGKVKKLSKDSFPLKLHYLLQEAERMGMGNVIAWLPHGRAFRVDNRKRFVVELLPWYFGMRKYESFQRQLNIYGFHWIKTGPDRNGYFSEYFVRHCPDIAAMGMIRQRKKGQGPRKPAVKAPNFYENETLPWMALSGPEAAASPVAFVPEPVLVRSIVTSAGRVQQGLTKRKDLERWLGDDNKGLASKPKKTEARRPCKKPGHSLVAASTPSTTHACCTLQFQIASLVWKELASGSEAVVAPPSNLKLLPVTTRHEGGSAGAKKVRGVGRAVLRAPLPKPQPLQAVVENTAVTRSVFVRGKQSVEDESQIMEAEVRKEYPCARDLASLSHLFHQTQAMVPEVPGTRYLASTSNLGGSFSGWRCGDYDTMPDGTKTLSSVPRANNSAPSYDSGSEDWLQTLFVVFGVDQC